MALYSRLYVTLFLVVCLATPLIASPLFFNIFNKGNSRTTTAAPSGFAIDFSLSSEDGNAEPTFFERLGSTVRLVSAFLKSFITVVTNGNNRDDSRSLEELATDSSLADFDPFGVEPSELAGDIGFSAQKKSARPPWNRRKVLRIHATEEKCLFFCNRRKMLGIHATEEKCSASMQQKKSTPHPCNRRKGLGLDATEEMCSFFCNRRKVLWQQKKCARPPYNRRKLLVLHATEESARPPCNRRKVLVYLQRKKSACPPCNRRKVLGLHATEEKCSTSMQQKKSARPPC
ncbi:hypothetical protein FHG87_023231 [Trinorchestia longiramus]|nr:hypothetical protein FHG87_023231 [Trinorchestia longiramus]